MSLPPNLNLEIVKISKGSKLKWRGLKCGPLMSNQAYCECKGTKFLKGMKVLFQ